MLRSMLLFPLLILSLNSYAATVTSGRAVLAVDMQNKSNDVIRIQCQQNSELVPNVNFGANVVELREIELLNLTANGYTCHAGNLKPKYSNFPWCVAFEVKKDSKFSVQVTSESTPTFKSNVDNFRFINGGCSWAG